MNQDNCRKENNISTRSKKEGDKYFKRQNRPRGKGKEGQNNATNQPTQEIQKLNAVLNKINNLTPLLDEIYESVDITLSNQVLLEDKINNLEKKLFPSDDKISGQGSGMSPDEPLTIYLMDKNKIPPTNGTGSGGSLIGGDIMMDMGDIKNGSAFNPLSLILNALVPKEKTEEEKSDSESDYESVDSDEEYDEIHEEIKNLDDLLGFIDKFTSSPLADPAESDEKFSYKKKKKKQKTVSTPKLNYPIDVNILSRLKEPLCDLKGMIGMYDIKNSIVDMVLYYLQQFEKKNRNMLHTVIEGPPGVGKTEVGKIIANIYASMGIIPTNKFKIVRRTDLIGEYVGHTAHKTQRAIDEANGGVLFIDEAYNLGSDEKRDSFSKECLDTLNQNLTENKKKLIVIIAGYPNELERCFFSYNPGLARRFPFRFKIEGYDPIELRNIFIKKVDQTHWKLSDNLGNSYFARINKHQKEFLQGDEIEKLNRICDSYKIKEGCAKYEELKKYIHNMDRDIRVSCNGVSDRVCTLIDREKSVKIKNIIKENVDLFKGDFDEQEEKIFNFLTDKHESLSIKEKSIPGILENIQFFWDDIQETWEKPIRNLSVFLRDICAEVKSTSDLDKLTSFFIKNKEKFPNFGGDIENLIMACKFSHSRRVFGLHPKYRRTFTMQDIEEGLNKFSQGKKEGGNELWKNMFM